MPAANGIVKHGDGVEEAQHHQRLNKLEKNTCLSNGNGRLAWTPGISVAKLPAMLLEI